VSNASRHHFVAMEAPDALAADMTSFFGGTFGSC
jgi:hypothetical protein